MAFVVEDRFQGHDVGRRLMQHLRDLALQNGMTEFVAALAFARWNDGLFGPWAERT
ncbi:MAG: hypothetical protein NVS2B16_12030 [Chloroflexota bacterium]